MCSYLSITRSFQHTLASYDRHLMTVSAGRSHQSYCFSQLAPKGCKRAFVLRHLPSFLMIAGLTHFGPQTDLQISQRLLGELCTGKIDLSQPTDQTHCSVSAW